MLSAAQTAAAQQEMKREQGAKGATGDQMAQSATKVDKTTMDRIIAIWKDKPKQLAQKLVGEWGVPQEATAQRLIWHTNDPGSSASS